MGKETDQEMVARKAGVSLEAYKLAELLAPHLWVSDYAPGIGDKGDYVTDPRTLALIVLSAGYTIPTPPADDVRETLEGHLREAVRMGIGWPKADFLNRWIAERLDTILADVRPHGTVTDAEHRIALHSAIRRGIESVQSGSADRNVVRAVADQVLALGRKESND